MATSTLDALAETPGAEVSPSAPLDPAVALESAHVDAEEVGEKPGSEPAVSAASSVKAPAAAEDEQLAPQDPARKAAGGAGTAEGGAAREGSVEMEVEASEPDQPNSAADDAADVKADEIQGAQAAGVAVRDENAAGAGSIGPADGKVDPADMPGALQQPIKRKKGRLAAAAAAAPRRQTRGSALAISAPQDSAEEAADTVDVDIADADGAPGGEPDAIAPTGDAQEKAAEPRPQAVADAPDAGDAARTDADVPAEAEDIAADGQETRDGPVDAGDGALLAHP